MCYKTEVGMKRIYFLLLICILSFSLNAENDIKNELRLEIFKSKAVTNYLSFVLLSDHSLDSASITAELEKISGNIDISETNLVFNQIPHGNKQRLYISYYNFGHFKEGKVRLEINADDIFGNSAAVIDTIDIP